jgi:hypothetical protein
MELAEDVLSRGGLVKVEGLDDNGILGGNGLDSLLLASIVDVIGAVTSVAAGRVLVMRLVVVEDKRAVALLEVAAFDTLEVVLQNRLARRLPLLGLLLVGELRPLLDIGISDKAAILRDKTVRPLIT